MQQIGQIWCACSLSYCNRHFPEFYSPYHKKGNEYSIYRGPRSILASLTFEYLDPKFISFLNVKMVIIICYTCYTKLSFTVYSLQVTYSCFENDCYNMILNLAQLVTVIKICECNIISDDC